jgi:uncharacterized protein (UPF0276 family)
MMDQPLCRGAGLGLRPAHLRQVCLEQPDIPWFEVHICNYLGGGLNRALLHQVAEHYRLSFHGVNLNLGGVDPLDRAYLQKLKRAVNDFQPALVSEHACFTAHGGHHFHDLLPVPYNGEAVNHMASRIRQVQDTLGRRILIENISRYASYDASDMCEAEFLTALCDEADCELLLDLNNAYVNQQNLGLNLAEFISGLPLKRVREIHLAGYSVQNGLLIDSHSAPPCPALWDYFVDFCELKPDTPCLIEWDSDLPALTELMHLQEKAQGIMNQFQYRNSIQSCS